MLWYAFVSEMMTRTRQASWRSVMKWNSLKHKNIKDSEGNLGKTGERKWICKPVILKGIQVLPVSSMESTAAHGKSKRKRQQREKQAATKKVERESEEEKEGSFSLSPLLIIQASTGAAAFNYKNLILVTAIIFGERNT